MIGGKNKIFFAENASMRHFKTFWLVNFENKKNFLRHIQNGNPHIVSELIFLSQIKFDYIQILKKIILFQVYLMLLAHYCCIYG